MHQFIIIHKSVTHNAYVVFVHTLDLILPRVSMMCDCIIISHWSIHHRHRVLVAAYLIEHEKSIIRTWNFSTPDPFVHHSNLKCVWRAIAQSISTLHQPVRWVRVIIIRLLYFPLLRLTQNFDWVCMAEETYDYHSRGVHPTHACWKVSNKSMSTRHCWRLVVPSFLCKHLNGSSKTKSPLHSF